MNNKLINNCNPQSVARPWRPGALASICRPYSYAIAQCIRPTP